MKCFFQMAIVAMSMTYMAQLQALSDEIKQVGDKLAQIGDKIESTGNQFLKDLNVFASVFGGSVVSQSKANSTASNGAVTVATAMSMNDGYTVGATVGAELKDVLSFEAEFARMSIEGTAKLTSMNGSVASTATLKSSEIVTTAMTSAWYEMKNESPIKPYVGGGMGVGWVNTKAGSWTASSSGANFSFQVGAGLKYALSNNMAVDIGYRYVSVPNVKMKSNGADSVFKNTDFNAHSVRLGVVYRF